MTINEASEVSLNFELQLQDGQIIDSNFDKAPATFKMGDGSLMSGFEEALIGLKAGDESSTVIPSEKAFGMPNPQNIQNMKREDFAKDIELEKGLIISFADANNSELPGVIKSWDEKWVEVDFNHPLAGKEIVFKVKVAEVN
ncbi:FKBP-type peptidyl-prolyl cis-trans isomerase [Marinicellulosiphila megalodicopiae]|uniref:FKBP-type peptidyl-prolyl cis-trans isomerase n=1 Tax=Marinicellulosiphila megalodicopiae TaxID=2724896 RepID=UPI003BAE9811